MKCDKCKFKELIFLSHIYGYMMNCTNSQCSLDPETSSEEEKENCQFYIEE